MLANLIVIAFFQASAPAVTAAPDASPAAKPVEMVCKMKPVTGSRARMQKICRPKEGFDKEAERAQERVAEMQRAGSIFQIPDPTQ